MKCYLDRDGIINYDYGYIGSLSRLDLVPEITPILHYLFDIGYDFHIVTNQSGIGRKYYSFKDFLEVTNFLFESFAFANFSVSFCPHLPSDMCRCRKPKIGMFRNESLSKYDILIGDKYTDMLSGWNFGIRNLYLISSDPFQIAKSLELGAIAFPSHLSFLEFLVATNALC